MVPSVAISNIHFVSSKTLCGTEARRRMAERSFEGDGLSNRALKVTVSGSFRRAMGAIEDAVYALTDAGVRVLSPADPRVVDQFGDFLFVASDRVRAIKLVQSRHLAAIESSDFVWLVAPEGYIGQSGAMEIGYAVAHGTPVFCSEVPIDLTLRQYVTTSANPQDAVRDFELRTSPRSEFEVAGNVLLDPTGAIEAAHEELELIAGELARESTSGSDAASAAAERLNLRIARPLRSP
jgi:hypothetical protein